MYSVRILVLFGVLTVPSLVHAAVINEEARRAMESQSLELQVDDSQIAMHRAEEWLTGTGHLPMPFGVTYLVHEHKGPHLKKGKLVSSCRLSGDAPPRTVQPLALDSPASRDVTLAPNTSADREAIPVRVNWRFEVRLVTEGNTVRIIPAKGSNREMVGILSRYIETGLSKCNTELTWLIDRPGHDPVAFDPVVHRQNPPTVDYRLCFDPID